MLRRPIKLREDRGLILINKSRFAHFARNTRTTLKLNTVIRNDSIIHITFMENIMENIMENNLAKVKQ